MLSKIINFWAEDKYPTKLAETPKKVPTITVEKPIYPELTKEEWLQLGI